KSLETIFGAVSRWVDPGGAEITVEVNPEDVDDGLMATLETLPVTRVSVGVQSMSRSGQRALGRCAPAVNERAVGAVRRMFTNFNIDLLLGIPGERAGALTDTLDRVLDMEPPHLSVYCLEPGGVLETQAGPFFEQVDQERAADEYLAVCERLRECGYRHYEVSNFAIPGFESRHNWVYWRGGEYLGIGPGAHSYLAGERFFNVASIEAYIEGGKAFSGTVRRHNRRDRDERRLEEIMLALRTSAGFPADRLPGGPPAAADLVQEGLAAVRQGMLVLSDRGFLLLNEIVRRLSGR
ncbi:MAG: coproporphyrinogen III oxidase, partial [bacterium]